ncbi:hypothetical protein JW859_10405 [bacterium]|nr:hypothetical protein [bacterium]
MSEDDTPKPPRQELPGPEGGHFYAPPDDRRKLARGRRKDDQEPALAGPVDYKLSHRSQRDFPEAYSPVSRTFWEGLSKEQQDAVMRLQAVAMEKAGFEKGAPKMFIADFDPSNPAAATGARGAIESDPVALAAPRLVLGGILLGMGGLALALSLIGMLQPLGIVAAASATALIIGGIMAANQRS